MTAVDAKARIVKMTPELAKSFLRFNRSNRKVSKATVDAYARDMAKGNWHLNGEAITFRKDGSLANGQHRLMACIKANVDFYVLVVTGIDNRATATIDTGRKRHVGDTLTIMGVKSGRAIAAAARMLYVYATGDFSTKLTLEEIQTIYTNHPRLIDGVRAAARQSAVEPSFMAAIYYIGKVVHEDPAIDEFINVFATGIPSYKNDPAHLFREKMLKMRASGTLLQQKKRMAMLAHVWSLFRAKKPATLLRSPDEIHVPGFNRRVLDRSFAEEMSDEAPASGASDEMSDEALESGKSDEPASSSVDADEIDKLLAELNIDTI